MCCHEGARSDSLGSRISQPVSCWMAIEGDIELYMADGRWCCAVCAVTSDVGHRGAKSGTLLMLHECFYFGAWYWITHTTLNKIRQKINWILQVIRRRFIVVFFFSQEDLIDCKSCHFYCLEGCCSETGIVNSTLLVLNRRKANQVKVKN